MVGLTAKLLLPFLCLLGGNSYNNAGSLLVNAQTYCGGGLACVDGNDPSSCSCCGSDSLETTCDAFWLADGSPPCYDATTRQDYVPGPTPPNYVLTEQVNCGWDPTKTIEENNAEKYVCPECTNSHYGFDIDVDVQECADICGAVGSDVCAGFAFFFPGALGADCLTHGGKKAGSCYFRSSASIGVEFANPGIQCYRRGEESKQAPNAKAAAGWAKAAAKKGGPNRRLNGNRRKLRGE